MIKKLLLFAFTALAVVSGSNVCSYTDNINLCTNSNVDRCYECTSINETKSSECVPIYQNSFGQLDNYPSQFWNCTIFNHDINSESKIYEEICKIDDFIVELCSGVEKNDYCMIADFIHEICEANHLNNSHSNMHTLLDLPDKLNGKLYPACFGRICQKEGWTYRQTMFGKDWCGNGTCLHIGEKVYCTVEIRCKYTIGNTSEINFNLEKNFVTMGCGTEKFKCMLKKSCRNLVREVENCNQDQSCVYNIVTGTHNEDFLKLFSCLYA